MNSDHLGSLTAPATATPEPVLQGSSPVTMTVAAATGAELQRAWGLVHLQHGGETLSQDSDAWLTDYLLRCPVEHVKSLHGLMDMLDDGA